MHSSYFTVTKVNLEKNHTETQEDSQEGNKLNNDKTSWNLSPSNMDNSRDATKT